MLCESKIFYSNDPKYNCLNNFVNFMTQLQYYIYSINCNFNFDHFLNILRIIYNLIS